MLFVLELFDLPSYIYIYMGGGNVKHKGVYIGDKISVKSCF